MNDRWTITLDPYEQRVCKGLAKIRNSDNDGSSQTISQDRDNGLRLAQDVMACMGEVAVAKILNLYWSGMGRKQVDVGFLLEVRSVNDPSLRLIARKADQPNAVLVLALVNQETAVCRAMGWQFVDWIRRRGRLIQDGARPYHIIDNAELRMMEELCEILIWRDDYIKAFEAEKSNNLAPLPSNPRGHIADH